MRGGRRESVKGVQYGSDNEQLNYYAPVTQYLFSGEFERLPDVRFNPPLARELDLARFTGREWLIKRNQSRHRLICGVSVLVPGL